MSPTAQNTPTQQATTPARTRAFTDPVNWLVGIGACQVVLGGAVAAVTGPLSLPRGSWLAAYLVLVCGVSQYAMGRVSTWIEVQTSVRRGWMLFAGWNVGNGVVITGTLTTTPYLVDVGGIILLVALLALLPPAVSFLRGARPRSRVHRWGGRLYLGLLIVLVVSVPIGLVLAHVRAG